MKRDTVIFDLIQKEKERQQEGIELIASENFVSDEVMEAMGSCLTNKYAEGYPGARYYGGCQIVDQTEQLAIDRACKLFGAEFANVQPHSGAQANAAVFFACMKPGDTYLGLDLAHGGHLSHGSPVNLSGINYRPIAYHVKEDTGMVDYDEMEALALEHKPKMIVSGASAYSRDWDFKRMREIADKVGALLMYDMAHPAGLIAKGLLNNPFEYCHIVTTTTHKTLRGPRGGLILCRESLAKQIDKAIFPGTQGGPLEHIIAAKAVCLGEAMSASFKAYQHQVVLNARALADGLVRRGFHLVSGGTDNHLMLVDLQNMNVTGKALEKRLDKVYITVNKNAVPNDPQSPFITSGIRIGTPAVTTRGLNCEDMDRIAEFIYLTATDFENSADQVRAGVEELCGKYPLYE